MAVDYFLKLGDIKGESQDDKHKDEIDVLQWSWGVSNAGTGHLGSGAGAGKANFQDLAITKYLDKASPNLLMKCATGEHIKEALLTCRKAGGKSPVDYLKVKLEGVFVTHVAEAGHGGDERQTESVTLHFSRVELDYAPQKEDGTALPAVSFKYNIAKNVPG